MSSSLPLVRKPLKFGYTYSPNDISDAFNPAQLAAQAKLAEAGRFDFIRFTERILSGEGGEARTEPFTTASYLATLTRKIGLIAQASTSYYEPFNLARLIASLDHVTHGRAGWDVATGASRVAHANFSQGENSAESHQTRAVEVIEILRQLWDSWEEGAFIRNKATGEYVDGNKIHPIHHKGDLFRIKGPLNVARSPQGHAVVTQVITDDIAADLAVREADLLLLTAKAPAELRAEVDSLRARLAGRNALILAAFTPAADNGRTIADRIEALAETAQLDGVDLHFNAPGALEKYVAEVVPELQTRGLLATEYARDTLRDHLGLTEPANRYAAA